MKRSHFLLSFIFARVLFLFVELPIVLLFAKFVFGVSVQGSLGLFALLSLLGTFAFSGLGLLVATRAQNTQTVSGLINLVMMPMFLFSGVFFSSANFPDFLQPFIRVLPLTALNDALRAVANEGAGLPAVVGPALVLSVIAVISVPLSVRLFRWS
jgi:ABC-type multidrug transport system permease subunit